MNNVGIISHINLEKHESETISNITQMEFRECWVKSIIFNKSYQRLIELIQFYDDFYPFFPQSRSFSLCGKAFLHSFIRIPAFFLFLYGFLLMRLIGIQHFFRQKGSARKSDSANPEHYCGIKLHRWRSKIGFQKIL